MDSQVNQLIDIINQEISSLEHFLVLLSDEQDFLVNHEVNALEKSVRDQEEAISQAEKLERTRIKLTNAIAEKLSLDTNRITLSKLIQLLEESYSTKLMELQKDLLDLYKKVERQRRKNEFLIKQSMGYIDKSMQILLGTGMVDFTYLKSGKKEKRPQVLMNQVG